MVYEQCLSERNSTLMNIFGQPDKIPENIPVAGALFNVTSANGSLNSLVVMPELPECDLQKELDNVSTVSSNYRSFALTKLVTISTMIVVGGGYRFGIYHLHGGDQSISWCAVLVGTILPDVIHARDRLSIRYFGRCRHQYCRYEALSKLEKGDSHRLTILLF